MLKLISAQASNYSQWPWPTTINTALWTSCAHFWVISGQRVPILPHFQLSSSSLTKTSCSFGSEWNSAGLIHLCTPFLLPLQALIAISSSRLTINYTFKAGWKRCNSLPHTTANRRQTTPSTCIHKTRSENESSSLLKVVSSPSL